MPFSDTTYIQVQVYDKPGKRDGLWGQVCALMPEEELQIFRPIQPRRAPHTNQGFEQALSHAFSPACREGEDDLGEGV